MHNVNKCKRKIFIKFVYIVLIIIFILSTIYIIKSILLVIEGIEESQLLNTIEIENIEEQNIRNMLSQGEINNTEVEIKKESESVERILKVQQLQKINDDIVGWIQIEGTNINYPVLQGRDNEYYLSHNYKKEKSEKGSIFLNYNYDWKIPSNNLLIYGHNLINGQMFKDLLKYKDEYFYKKHKNIRFTTNNKDIEYEILSAFYSKIYYKMETNAFKFYEFINSKKDEEYNKFIDSAKNISLYNTGVEAKYGDELITLVTCSYHVDDGRFVVIGRKR